MNSGNPGYCVYVTGQTFSDDYPVSSVVAPYNAIAPMGGSPTAGNAFITKLNPYVSGASSLLYSSYLASENAKDLGHGVAVDTNQNAYITGITLANPGAPPNFPITGSAAQATLQAAPGNAFLTVLSTTTASTGGLVYSTYLGGNDANTATSVVSGGDIGWGVAVDSNKIAYVVGTTPSTNFPNLNSTSTFPSIKGWAAAPSGNTQGAGFLAALNTTVSGVNSLVYSTYVGGQTAEVGNAVALAGNGTVFITGQTLSPNFFTTESGTTVGQFPSPADASGVVFVAKLNTAATGAPTYSVLLGGTSGEIGNGIQVDGLGNVVVVGTTQSSNFPITPGAFKTALTGSAVGDAFIAKLSPAGQGSADLLYSSYFGGSGTSTLIDRGYGLALDSSGNAYLTGQTYSTDFPTSAGAFQSTFPTGALSTAYVSKLTLLPVLAFAAPCSTTQAPPASCLLAFGNQIVHTASTPLPFIVTNNTSAAMTLTIPLPTVTGANATDFSAVPAPSGATAACTTSLAAGASCAIGVTFTPSVVGAESAALPVNYTYNNGTSTAATGSQTATLTGTGTAAVGSTPTATVSPSPLTFTGELVTTTSAAQAITVTNTGSTTVSSTATPSISGTNASDFAIVASGTTCTTTLAASASCQIKISFTPPAGSSGSQTAILNIPNNATGSPQSVNLVGTAWDFALSAQAVTVSPGSTGTIAVTVTGVGGFTGSVILACTGTIPEGTCTAPSTSVTATGTGNVTVTTQAALVPPASTGRPPISMHQVVLAAFALMFLFSFPVVRNFRGRLGLIGATVVLIAMAGCSGSKKASTTTTGTAVGTYPMTITGSSQTVSHTITVNVTVN
jgi:Beta-propeller repeat